MPAEPPVCPFADEAHSSGDPFPPLGGPRWSCRFVLSFLPASRDGLHRRGPLSEQRRFALMHMRYAAAVLICILEGRKLGTLERVAATAHLLRCTRLDRVHPIPSGRRGPRDFPPQTSSLVGPHSDAKIFGLFCRLVRVWGPLPMTSCAGLVL